ncbi:MAG: tetratricopeptide repeat protein [Verrucomicrobiota bacterium]|nr:tetratricopeptide repeat protein [Verrucomicrobiota bacterium]
MKLKSFVLFVLGAACLCLTARADEAPSIFKKANADFAAGHFREAVDGYEQLVGSGRWSANLFYDLGNAYFRAGNSGKAILNYERALALDPKQPEATANLRVVRDEARALEMRRSETDRYIAFATSTQWTIAAAVGFWIAAFAAVGWFFRRGKSAVAATVFVCGILASGIATYATWTIENGSGGRALAVITADKIQARLATADNSGTVLALPPGSEVQVLNTRGGWVYAALPNDLRGWIPATAAELVRL